MAGDEGKAVARRNRRGTAADSGLSAMLAETIVRSLAAGTYISTACRYAGLSDHTYRQWRRRGTDELARVRGITDQYDDIAARAMIDAGGQFLPFEDCLNTAPKPFDRKEWPFVVFVLATDRARAVAELNNLTIIKSAAAKNWSAAAWLLERVHRDKYGRVVQSPLTGADGAAAAIAGESGGQQVTADMLEDKLAEVMREVNKDRAGQEGEEA